MWNDTYDMCLLTRNKKTQGLTIIIIIIIATQGRVVNGERRHAEPPGGNDHPQLNESNNLKFNLK